jgi:hypothetical protein
VTLPYNGLRLRFDGPDQRLRLIEAVDFSLSSFNYKNTDLVRRAKGSEEANQDPPNASGPTFRHIYSRLFGPTYAGEYLSPAQGESDGTYVLSYPGLAFTFPIKHKSWSDKVDFVSILSSTATGPAKSMAIFSGSSWAEARSNLYTRAPAHPRNSALIGKSADVYADEVEEVRVLGGGRLEMLRRSSASMLLTLNETTPQDLIAELGPPDAIYRKQDRRISIHATANTARHRRPSMSPGLDPQAIDTDQSSYTEESDVDHDHGDTSDLPNHECFYNYFSHGFDVLISAPQSRSPAFPGMNDIPLTTASSAQLAATKIFLHGNIPGSFSFNRHRRSRWVIRTGSGNHSPVLTSEMPFSEISAVLKKVWRHTYTDENDAKQMQRGMVLNRGWDDSPESSIELLGDLDESLTGEQVGGAKAGNDGAAMSNTQLYGFPGTLFEVLKNDMVTCLTIF